MHRILACLAAVSSLAAAQGVTSAIAPPTSPPPSCSENYDGSFQIATANASSSNERRSLEIRQTSHNPLGITLQNGILTDQSGRTGYIASNQQFQFDDPPQAGAIYTAGFSVCSNGSLAIGNNAIWERCLSGPGNTNSGFFYNLYLKNDGGQCIESYIIAVPVSSGDGPASGPTSAGSSTLTSSTTASSSASASPTASAVNSTTSAMSLSTGTSTMNGTMTTKTTRTANGMTSTITSTTSPMRATSTKVVGATGQGSAQSSAATTAGAAASSTTAGGFAAPTLAAGRDLVGLAAGVLALMLI